jgi:hypothetical protein
VRILKLITHRLVDLHGRRAWRNPKFHGETSEIRSIDSGVMDNRDRLQPFQEEGVVGDPLMVAFPKKS